MFGNPITKRKDAEQKKNKVPKVPQKIIFKDQIIGPDNPDPE
jgi:hypothetical protein